MRAGPRRAGLRAGIVPELTNKGYMIQFLIWCVGLGLVGLGLGGGRSPPRVFRCVCGWGPLSLSLSSN